MGNRKQANRAVAIVRAIGAILMLLVLLIIVQIAPRLVQGRDPGQAITALLQMPSDWSCSAA